MDEFLLIYRAIAVVIIATWMIALVRTRDKPPEWAPDRFRLERWPLFRMTRDRYRLIAVAGIVAGAYSFVLPSL